MIRHVLLDADGVLQDLPGDWLTAVERVEVADSSLGLVDALRDHGLGVHLATNQTAARAAYMRAELGYDELFDESFYSCEVGAAKPDSAFFSAAVARLGTTPPEVLLVDDSERNVTAAREVGLAAEHWHLRDGTARLRGLLADHGILL